MRPFRQVLLADLESRCKYLIRAFILRLDVLFVIRLLTLLVLCALRIACGRGCRIGRKRRIDCTCWRGICLYRLRCRCLDRLLGLLARSIFLSLGEILFEFFILCFLCLQLLSDLGLLGNFVKQLGYNLKLKLIPYFFKKYF